MNNSFSSISDSFFDRCITLNLFYSLSSYFQGKPVGTERAFTMGNHPRQLAAAPSFLNCEILLFGGS